MTLGLVDLSIVTDRLIGRLKTWALASPIQPESETPPYSIDYSGLAPDAARKATGETSCHLSMYLFHVAADKFHRNTYPTGGSPQRTPEQPLALNLFYLLTAYSKNASSKAFVEEQQAMSIALKCFHENPIVTETIDGRDEELTLTIEPQSIDEVGRLWQSLSTPLRLSAVYRVSVVFIAAPERKTPQVVRHTPDFAPPHEILPRVSPQPPSTGVSSADRYGVASIDATGADFLSSETTVQLRALALTETTHPTGLLPIGEFRIDAPRRLSLRVPLFTPEGEYLVTVRAAPDQPIEQVALTVAQQIVDVPVDAGLALIVIADADFTSGAVAVVLDTIALAEGPTTIAGQFQIVPPDTLELRVPAGIAQGRHPITITVTRPIPRPPTVLALWLRVP